MKIWKKVQNFEDLAENGTNIQQRQKWQKAQIENLEKWARVGTKWVKRFENILVLVLDFGAKISFSNYGWGQN